MHTPSSLLENALNATASHVAVLDGDGVIRYANQAWSSFCLLNGGSETSCGVGANYLTTCELACGNFRHPLCAERPEDRVSLRLSLSQPA